MSHRTPSQRLSTARRLSPWLVLNLLAASVGAAFAQTAPTPAAAASAPPTKKAEEVENLATVVVTAQKRLQEAQSVPISLYSVTGQTLERTGVKSVQDLGNSVAGVTIGALNPGELSINIRGVTDLSEAPENSSANGLYIDEAPLGGIPGHSRTSACGTSSGSRFCVARRALCSVKVRWVAPSASSPGSRIRRTSSARVAFGGSKVSGGGSGYRAQASVNVPLVRDQLALIAAVGKQKLPGWVSIPDIGAKNANEATKTDQRLALRWTPQRALTVDASYISSETVAGDGGATSPGLLDPVNAFPGAGPIKARSERDNHSQVANLTINYDFGPVTLVSSSTAFDQKVERNLDNSFIAPLFFGPAGAEGSVYGSFPSRVKAFTQEVRLSSNGDLPLNWTVGAYYRNANQDILNNGYTITVPGFGLVDDKNLSSETHKVKAQAVFGELEYKLTSSLSAQAGLRYYSETKDVAISQETSSAIFGTTAGTTASGTNKANATSPKFVLNWTVSPETLLFAKVSKGFRGGGANTLSAATYPDAPRGFKPESLVAYELGAKMTPAKGWYLNTYLYRNNWTDLQLALTTPDGLNGYTQNVGKAESTGAEIELGGRVIPGLNVGVNFAYVDAKFKSTVVNAQGAVVAQEGNRIQLTPKTKLGLTADYSFDISEAFRAQLTGRYRVTSASYSEISNRESERNGASQQLYLRAALRSGDWEVGVYGDNLLNRDDSNFKRRPISAIPLVFTTYVPPRTLGVDFKLNF